MQPDTSKPTILDYDKGTEMVKPIRNPQAFILRSNAAAGAARGEYPNKECPHPIEMVEQYVDEDPAAKRKGRALNLFECTLCHSLLWLVDPYGNEALDE